jgi:hypothetical protein
LCRQINQENPELDMDRDHPTNDIKRAGMRFLTQQYVCAVILANGTRGADLVFVNKHGFVAG